MVGPEGSREVRDIDAPGLLIVTGPSHVGKTVVSREVLATTPGPAAYLSVDDTLERILPRAPDDIWSEIPLAYELIRSELQILLQKGWFVCVESTFTYVSEDGQGDFHRDALDELIETASSFGAPWWIVQLTATRETILSRRRRTDRLSEAIVIGTYALHRQASLPPETEVLDTGELAPAEAAAAIFERLGAGR